MAAGSIASFRPAAPVALAHFRCPMHPEVFAAAAGECPICGMALEPAGERSDAEPALPPRPYFDVVRQRTFGQDIVAPAMVAGDGVILAVLYKEELAALSPGGSGSFWKTGSPDATIGVRVSAVAPEPWDRSTARVRFEPSWGAPVLHGDVGFVRLPGVRRDVLVVPAAAIFEGAEGPLVLVAPADDEALVRRPVEVGRVFGGSALVLSGVRPHERILVRDVPFYDAELRLHAGLAGTAR